MTIDTTPVWDRYAGPPPALYERYFVPAIGRHVADALVEVAAPRAGERALDVACGTGVVARLVAERVGRGGSVAGVDGNAGMLDIARSTSHEVEWRHANAEGLPFDDDVFDVALCSLGLQFFANTGRALAEMRRVVRPGGRLAVATVGPISPAFRALREVLAAHLGDHVASFIDVIFSIDDPQGLHDLVDAAGFTEVTTRRRPVRLHLGPPADFFWQYLLGTPLAEHVAGLDADARTALEAAIVARWQPLADDLVDDLVDDVDIVVGTARV